MAQPHTSYTRLAARMNDITAFEAVDLFTKARRLEAEGRSIIHRTGCKLYEPDKVL